MIYYLALSLAALCVGLESVSYFGFIENKIGLSSLYIYLLSFIVSIYYGKTTKIPSKLLKLTIVVTSIIYALLIALETYFYPNYVYSHLHINPSVAQFALALLTYHALLHLKLDWRKAVLFAALLYVFVDGGGRTLGLATRGLAQFANDPLASYSTKLARTYPGFYETTQEIVRLTPPNSTILIPPQSNPWELEGNGAMVRYFVYPREVKNLEGDLVIPKVDRPTYILIAKGSAKQRVTAHDYGWPKRSIPGKNVWRLGDQKELELQPDTTYHYDPRNLWSWGLIEVTYAD